MHVVIFMIELQSRTLKVTLLRKVTMNPNNISTAKIEWRKEEYGLVVEITTRDLGIVNYWFNWQHDDMLITWTAYFFLSFLVSWLHNFPMFNISTMVSITSMPQHIQSQRKFWIMATNSAFPIFCFLFEVFTWISCCSRITNWRVGNPERGCPPYGGYPSCWGCPYVLGVSSEMIHSMRGISSGRRIPSKWRSICTRGVSMTMGILMLVISPVFSNWSRINHIPRRP